MFVVPAASTSCCLSSGPWLFGHSADDGLTLLPLADNGLSGAHGNVKELRNPPVNSAIAVLLFNSVAKVWNELFASITRCLLCDISATNDLFTCIQTCATLFQRLEEMTFQCVLTQLILIQVGELISGICFFFFVWSCDMSLDMSTHISHFDFSITKQSLNRTAPLFFFFFALVDVHMRWPCVSFPTWTASGNVFFQYNLSESEIVSCCDIFLLVHCDSRILHCGYIYSATMQMYHPLKSFMASVHVIHATNELIQLMRCLLVQWHRHHTHNHFQMFFFFLASNRSRAIVVCASMDKLQTRSANSDRCMKFDTQTNAGKKTQQGSRWGPCWAWARAEAMNVFLSLGVTKTQWIQSTWFLSVDLQANTFFY